MLLFFAVWIAFIFCAVEVLAVGFYIITRMFSIMLLAVAFVILLFWSVSYLSKLLANERAPAIESSKPPRKAPQPASSRPIRQPQPAHPSAEDSDIRQIRFKVAGVTFDNEDGTSRQDILRHLKFYDSPYADAEEEYDTEIEETTFDGDPALAVFVNGYQVGFVPAKIVPKVQKAMTCLAFSVDSTTITGGGTTDDGEKIYYGCNITASYIA